MFKSNNFLPGDYVGKQHVYGGSKVEDFGVVAGVSHGDKVEVDVVWSTGSESRVVAGKLKRFMTRDAARAMFAKNTKKRSRYGKK